VQSGLVAIVAYAFVLLAVDSTYAIQKSETIANWVSLWLKRLRLLDLDQAAGDSDRLPQAPRIVLLGFFRVASSLLEELRLSRPNLLTELLVVDFNPTSSQNATAQRGVTMVTSRAGAPACRRGWGKNHHLHTAGGILKAPQSQVLRQLRTEPDGAHSHARNREEARNSMPAPVTSASRATRAAEISALEASDNLLDESAAMIEQLDERAKSSPNAFPTKSGWLTTRRLDVIANTAGCVVFSR
jgi:hypothetical protein